MSLSSTFINYLHTLHLVFTSGLSRKIHCYRQRSELHILTNIQSILHYPGSTVRMPRMTMTFMQSRQSVADEPEKQVEEAKLVRKIDLRVILPVCR